MLKLASLLLALVIPTHVYADQNFAEGTGATFNCGDDPVVNITHDQGTYTLLGDCREINVSGSNLRLTIEHTSALDINGVGNNVNVTEVGAININGTKNSVKWKRAESGRRPAVGVNGRGNSVRRSR